MEPCVDDCFNILCSPALGLEGNVHFRQPFYKCHNGTFRMDADDGIAFQMSKFFFECWVVRLSVREFPSESLSPTAFLMAVGFRFPFIGKVETSKSLRLNMRYNVRLEQLIGCSRRPTITSGVHPCATFSDTYAR